MLKPLLLSLWDETNEAALSIIKAEAEILPSTFENNLNSHDCWRYPDDDTSILSFDSIIKGFVPTSLTNTLSQIFLKKDVSRIVCAVFSAAKELFHKHVWLFRCEEFDVFELSEGITQQLKHSPYKSSSTSPTSSSISHLFALLISADTKWKSWIAQSLNTGRPWSGFLSHINSLIQ